RRLDDRSSFPWLSASRLPELLLYHPFSMNEVSGEPLPTHVRTPAGTENELRSTELWGEIAERVCGTLELIELKQGDFDDAAVSVITRRTIGAIGREVGASLDTRRFRANVLLDTQGTEPFEEDEWLGGRLLFGDSDQGPAVSVTSHDVRCKMINLDPDT